MTVIQQIEQRWHADRGWLDSYHTFSFSDYHDSAHMGFRALRVINDDRIAPGKGFGPHAHRDMEIITYVLDGRLLHRDSMGERHVLKPNEVQTMSAGTGIVHSEFNASETEPVHSIQIWIQPAQDDVEPSYQQIAFPPAEKRGRLRLLAAPAAGGSKRITTIHQDALVYASEVESGAAVQHVLATGRHAWIQVVRGDISLNGELLKEGDGAAVSSEQKLLLAGSGSGGELLLFDLA